MRPRILLAALTLLLGSAGHVLGVGLPAGHTFQLVAEADYSCVLEGLQSSDPASVQLTVAQVAAVDIEVGVQYSDTPPGGYVYMPMRVVNSGNGPDSFLLSGTSASGWDVSFIYDDNDDGSHQDSEQWEVTSVGLIVADGYSPCFARVTVPAGAADGDTITVRAVSVYNPVQGITETPMVLSPVVPPHCIIKSPTTERDYATTSPTINLAGEAGSPLGVASVTWASDRGGSGQCTGTVLWNVNGIALQPGLNRITVTVRDNGDRISWDRIYVTYNTGGTPPAVQITSPTADPSYTTANPVLAIAGSATDDTGVASVSWSSDRGGSGACTGTTSWSAGGIVLQSGQNVVTVSATNTGGSVGTDTLTVTYNPDAGAPTVEITGPTSNATYTTTNATVDIAGSASGTKTVSSVTWSNSRGGSGTCTGTASWSAAGIVLQVGQNAITVAATDIDARTGTDTITVTYNVPDTTAPSVQIVSPTSEPTYSTSATPISIAVSATDNVAVTSVQWSSDRGGSGSFSDTGTSSWIATGIALQSGQNVITVTAKDAANNSATDTLTVTYSADSVNPTIQITSPTNQPTYTTESSTLAIAGSASDNVGVVSVAWSNDRGGSGTATGTTSWSANVTGLRQGQNVITVTASDALGNKGAAVLTVTCNTTDTVAPTVQITKPTTAAECGRNSSQLIITASASDDTGVVDVAWYNQATGQGGALSPSGAGWVSEEITLISGLNTIAVTAYDAAGNSAAASLKVSYIDAVPGDAWRGVAMVSVPLIPDKADPKEVVGFHQNSWATYRPAFGTYASYPDAFTWFDPAQLTPGRGFWARFDGAGAVPVGTIPSQTQPAAIRLQRGWNQVGQPFLSAIRWDVSRILVRTLAGNAQALKDSGNLVAGFAWGWRQNAQNPSIGDYYLVYDSSLAPGVDDQLEPWRAYWVIAYTECDLILPAPTQ